MTPHAVPDALPQLADALAGPGYAVLCGVLPASLESALLQQARERSGEMTRAGIGRGREHLLDGDIRRDRTAWLDRAADAERVFLDWLETLRLALNRELFMGLFDVEAQFAWYPPGAFYRCHLDAFQEEEGAVVAPGSNRILSAVFYLNPDWPAGAGGELVLYGHDGQHLATVQPQAGTAVFFLSEQFPHEVLPAHRDRYSIAAWFRRNGSSSVRADPPS